MKRLLTKFARKDDGAVTVDWVVLTAAMVGMAIFILTSTENATLGLTDAAGAAVVESTTY